MTESNESSSGRTVHNPLVQDGAATRSIQSAMIFRSRRWHPLSRWMIIAAGTATTLFVGCVERVATMPSTNPRKAEHARETSSPDAASKSEMVPSWFPANNRESHTIFDAWRKLSTPGAAIFWHKGWRVVAGQLSYDDGTVGTNCPLTVRDHDEGHMHSAWLTTNRDGYFILYGAFGEVCEKPSRTQLPAGPSNAGSTLQFSASPGYPFCWGAKEYATARRDWKECEVNVLANFPDRTFVRLTCPKRNRFSADGFEAFKRHEMAEFKKRTFSPRREPLQARSGSTDRGIRNVYRVRVVTPSGQGIPDARLKFTSYDGFEGNDQVVATDEKGFAELVEEHLKNRTTWYYNHINRWLSIDIPGCAAGPISAGDLKADRLNVITACPAASVSGKVVDWNGNAVRAQVKLDYERSAPSLLSDAPTAPDGTFMFSRILPGEKFRVRAWVGQSQFATPMGIARTPYMTLAEGEKKKGMELRLKADRIAICGAIVDQDNVRVSTISDLQFVRADGTSWGYLFPPLDHFGSGAPSDEPFQIRIEAKGFKSFLSNKIELAPGEIRFVKLQMEKLQRKTERKTGSDLNY
jgi:hypothetical protein